MLWLLFFKSNISERSLCESQNPFSSTFFLQVFTLCLDVNQINERRVFHTEIWVYVKILRWGSGSTWWHKRLKKKKCSRMNSPEGRIWLKCRILVRKCAFVFNLWGWEWERSRIRQKEKPSDLMGTVELKWPTRGCFRLRRQVLKPLLLPVTGCRVFWGGYHLVWGHTLELKQSISDRTDGRTYLISIPNKSSFATGSK